MRTRGFTLVELLVVITIIGMLVALLFPAINAVLTAVEKAHCQANLRGLVQLVDAYARGNDGFLPPTGQRTGLASRYEASWLCNRRYEISGGLFASKNMLGDRDILICPSHADEWALEPVEEGWTAETWTKDGVTHNRPAQRNAVMTSYLMNANLNTSRHEPEKINNFGAKTFILIEAAPDSSYDDAAMEPNNANDAKIATRHQRSGHIGMLGGHVRAFTPEEFNLTLSDEEKRKERWLPAY